MTHRENVEAIASLFPHVVTERLVDGDVERAIDFDLLRQELSEYVVDGPAERYRLDWPGKRAALLAANTPTTKTVRPDRDASVDFDTTANLFLEGDNLDALKLLTASLVGRVKLIYIDPPYNTGNDFLYADDFTRATDDYLAASGQVEDGVRLVANPESSGRFHSDWLSMMYPRLKLARSLLADDGIIFASIDDHEGANLRRLMDEVFGEANLFAEMVVVRAEGGGLAKRVVKGHDYLIGYTRNADAFPGMFRAKDVRGEVVDVDGRSFWIETDWLRAEFGKYGTLAYEDVEAVKGAAKKAEIDAGLADGRYRLIPRGDGHIVGRLRPLDQDGSKFYSVLKHLTKDAKDALAPLGMDGLFSNPKPLSLLTELVMGATRFTPNDEQIVLDFFAGSGTTAHAVMAANAEDGGNRRFVLVQLPEVCAAGTPAAEAGFGTIAELAQERVRRVGASLASGDRGMRVLRIVDGESSVRGVEVDQRELGAGFAQTPQELLFRVLLEGGYDLASEISVESIAGAEVFVVGGLVACFEDKVTDELVDGLIALAPARVVLLDSAFGDDASRMNAEARLVGAGVEVVVR